MDTEVNMHVQEFCENSVDFAHFQYLHGNMMVPFTSISVPGIKIHHEASFRKGEGNIVLF